MFSNMPADPWSHLRRLTSARIALGRAGSSLPTAEVLDFAAAHAEARDAVHAPLDVDRLAGELREFGSSVVQVQSQAQSQAEYLQRPDLGRRLDEASHVALSAIPGADLDVAVIVADGLSAIAPQLHASPLLRDLLPRLVARGLRVGPVVVARHARVALQDEAGELLRARLSLILIGERPGLGAADSLGAYLVFGPKIGCTDAERNCVSNIRPAGMPLAAAAELLDHLIASSLRLGLSGVRLKDDRPLPRRGAAAHALPA